MDHAADPRQPGPLVRRLLVSVLTLWAVLMALMGLAFLLRERAESWALAGFGAALACAAGAVVIHRDASWARWTRRGGVQWLALSVALALWLALAVVAGVALSCNAWDEGAYLLSGLALRGYPVEYAAHRAPVTSLLAALFADAPHLMNPALILILMTLLAFWVGRRHGPLHAAAVLLILVTQDAFTHLTIDVMAELPAAVILVAAFLALSRRRFFLAGLLLALSVLTRWNLVMIPLAAWALVLWRYRWTAALQMAAAAAALAALFLGLSFHYLDHPLRTIYELNVKVGYDWSADPENRPDFLSRSLFYAQHMFLLRPLLLAGLVCRPWLGRGDDEESDEDWTLRLAAPVALLAYMASMLWMGGHFVRFMAPILPLACVVWWDAVVQLARRLNLGDEARVHLGALVLAGTVALGLWPQMVVFGRANAQTLSLQIKDNLRFRPPLSAELARSITRALPANEPILAPLLGELTHSNGYPLKYQLRRRVIFPRGDKDATGAIIARTDAAAASAEALALAAPGAAVLLPAGINPPVHATLLASDPRWRLYRLTPGE